MLSCLALACSIMHSSDCSSALWSHFFSSVCIIHLLLSLFTITLYREITAVACQVTQTQHQKLQAKLTGIWPCLATVPALLSFNFRLACYRRMINCLQVILASTAEIGWQILRPNSSFGISALRALRLLRIFKMTRWPPGGGFRWRWPNRAQSLLPSPSHPSLRRNQTSVAVLDDARLEANHIVNDFLPLILLCSAKHITASLRMECVCLQLLTQGWGVNVCIAHSLYVHVC